MPAAPRVAVVVTAYRPGRYFDECLTALAHQSYPELAIVVVDATGDDPELRASVELFVPQASFVRGPGELGYGACANAGANAVVDAPFILFLHDDAVLAPGAVASMVEVAYAANAGIVTPKLVDFDEDRRLVTVGWDLTVLFAPVARVSDDELDQGQLDEVVDVDAAPGAAMLVRRDLFEALDGFDEGFGLVGEDVDLSARARLLGARIVTAPHAKVRHRGVRERAARRARRRRQVGRRVLEERVGWTSAERVGHQRRAARLLISSLYEGVALAEALVLFVAARLLEALLMTMRGSPRTASASLRAVVLSRPDREMVRRRRRAARSRELSAFGHRGVVAPRRESAAPQRGPASSLGAPPRRLARWIPRSDGARRALLAAEVVAVLGVRNALLSTGPGGTLLGGMSAGTLLGAWSHALGSSIVLGRSVAPLGTGLVGLLAAVLGGDVGAAVRLLVLLSAVASPLLVARLARRELSELPASLVALAWAVGPGLALGVARASLSLIVAWALIPALVGATLAASQSQRLSPRIAVRARRRLDVVVALALAIAPMTVIVWGGLVALELGVWAAIRDEYRLRRLGRAAGEALGLAVLTNLPWVVALVVWHPGVSVVFHGAPGALAQSLAAHLFGAGYLVGPGPWLVVVAAVAGLGAALGEGDRAQVALWRTLTGVVLGAIGALASLGLFGANPFEPAYVDDFAALLVLLAAPHGIDAARGWLRRRRLGPLHLLGVGLGLAAALVSLWAVASALIAPAAPVTLPEASVALAGGFSTRPLQTLWIEVGPGGPIRGAPIASNVSLAVTNGAQPTFLGQLGPPVTAGYGQLRPLVIDALAGQTVELGRALARAGIGEVVVLVTQPSPLARAVALGIERQVDLRQLLGTSSLTVNVTDQPPRQPAPGSVPAWFVLSEVVAAGTLAWLLASLVGVDVRDLRRFRTRREVDGSDRSFVTTEATRR